MHQAQVSQADRPVRCDQHVLQLDIAVRHAVRVQVLQRLEDLLHDVQRTLLAQRYAGPSQQVGQVTLRAVLSRYIHIVGVLVHVVEADDVGVAERLQGGRLAAHRQAPHGVADVRLAHDLEGVQAAFGSIHDLEDGAHGAVAYPVDDFVTGGDGSLHCGAAGARHDALRGGRPSGGGGMVQRLGDDVGGHVCCERGRRSSGCGRRVGTAGN